MSRTIVVGVDGSDTAARAANTAAELAKALGAKLLLVCAYEKAEVTRIQAGSEEFMFSSEAEARKTAESVAGTLASVTDDIVPMARRGKPAEALIDVAEDRDAILIVVGNKRVQGIARILGSIASDVAAKAPCDVYIAHTHR